MKPEQASLLAIFGSILILIVVAVFLYHLYSIPIISSRPNPSPFESPLFDMLVIGALMVLVGELFRLRK
jgi:hypothetical protein